MQRKYSKLSDASMSKDSGGAGDPPATNQMSEGSNRIPYSIRYVNYLTLRYFASLFLHEAMHPTSSDSEAFLQSRTVEALKTAPRPSIRTPLLPVTEVSSLYLMAWAGISKKPCPKAVEPTRHSGRTGTAETHPTLLSSEFSCLQKIAL
jgi:hypothetical protein